MADIIVINVANDANHTTSVAVFKDRTVDEVKQEVDEGGFIDPTNTAQFHMYRADHLTVVDARISPSLSENN